MAEHESNPFNGEHDRKPGSPQAHPRAPADSGEATTPITMVEAALDLASKGWRVHPCRPQGPKAKSPLLPHGHLEAASNPEKICGWWARWPNAMIGAVVPESLFVLDIDPRNGGSVEALEAVAGTLPATLSTWSGREDGGRHLYFLRPRGELTSGNLPPGIDLKLNGYLIMPPSLHPSTGRAYRWEPHAVASVPPALREVLRPPRPEPSRTQGRQPECSALVRLVGRLTAGERNRGLFWAACRATEKGLLPAVEDDLVAAATSVGLPEREARKTIVSARRTAGSQR